MVTRVFFFLFGFGLMVIGFTYMIMYLNILALGYSFKEYLNYIFHRYECMLTIIGFIIINISIYVKGKNKNDTHL